jgi:glycosyltransferase involved in cell wall biosynthesis
MLYPIKILLIYHGAALAPSKKIFEAIAARSEIRLRVLAPHRGFNPLRGSIFEIPKPLYSNYALVTGRVYKAMRDFSGPYITGLIREMLTFLPDVIHVMNEAASHVHFQTLVYRNLFLRRAKVLFFGFENIMNGPNTSFSRFKWNFICRYGNGGGYANTEGLKRIIELGYPSENLVLTFWGVPLEHFRPMTSNKIRKELGLNQEFVVGYIGRFLKEKGIKTLLYALEKLPDSVKGLFIGDGPMVEEFERNIYSLGLEKRVFRFPSVQNKDINNYLNAMDTLVIPSETTPTWKEQFGRVIAEAMACGVPIIGSDSGAIPEVIGDAGLVFPEKNSDVLKKNILLLKESPQLRHHLHLKGMRRSHEKFSCHAFSDKLLNLYYNSLCMR